MLTIGEKAPDFTLPDQNGKEHTLSEYRGKKVVLYFYSKDGTSGCTKQAIGYSERAQEFSEKNAVVLGVSKDSVATHKNFEEKYFLRLTLLSDTERTAIESYGVWGEKKMCGKVGTGVIRTTYVIDENGIIEYADGKVRAAEDAETLLAYLNG